MAKIYIGEVEIKKVIDKNDTEVTLEFEDDIPNLDINKELFENLKKDKVGRGTITDNVNHLIATKFLMELSDYGLEYYMVENVTTAMKVLAHNMREDLIRKTFDCSGGDAILLSKLVEDEYEKE